MRNTNWLRWLPVLLIVLLLLSACSRVPKRTVQPVGTEPAGGGAAAEMTSIKVLTVGGDSALDALISAFYAKYPRYRVDKVTVQPGNNMAEAVRLKLNEGAVDVVPVGLGAGMDIGTLVTENHVVALDPFIKKSKLDMKAFGPALEQLRIDGTLYDLPYTVRPWVIMYNQDMFQAAGQTIPTEGWTWDQFRAAARALTRGEGDAKVWGAATYQPEVLIAAYVAQKGPDAVTDEKVLREALQFFHTMTFTDRSLQPARKRSTSTSPFIRIPFEQGKAGMMMEQLTALSYLQTQVKFKWNVAPLPVHPGSAAAVNASVQTYAIAATGANPEGAWTFLQFAAGPEGAAALARAGTLPMYNNAEVKRAWLDRQPPPPAGTESLFHTTWQVAARTDATQIKLATAANTLYNQALSGERPWEDALADYMRQVKEIRAEAR